MTEDDIWDMDEDDDYFDSFMNFVCNDEILTFLDRLSLEDNQNE